MVMSSFVQDELFHNINNWWETFFDINDNDDEIVNSFNEWLMVHTVAMMIYQQLQTSCKLIFQSHETHDPTDPTRPTDRPGLLLI